MAPKADEVVPVPGGFVLIWNNLGGVSAEAGYVTMPALPVPVPVLVPIHFFRQLLVLLAFCWVIGGSMAISVVMNSTVWVLCRGNSIGGILVGLLRGNCFTF